MSGQKKSKYREKVESGKQMYGPGCCAHKLTPERMRSIRAQHGTTQPGNPIR